MGFHRRFVCINHVPLRELKRIRRELFRLPFQSVSTMSRLGN